MPADLPQELLARAAGHGLTRGRAWWTRSCALAIAWEGVGALAGQWFWAPETLSYGQERGLRAACEAEALTAACDWIEAGEPEVPRG